jgi:sigma-E factor negative regulatory protein RseA
MSEQIREQISAFLDGELPASETELLLKRLTRDAELRESFGRYALIGEALRTGTRSPLSREFATRVNARIDGEPAVGGAAAAAAVRRTGGGWWRPVAGAAVAAGVAAVAVVALQQRAVAPSIARAPAPTAAVALVRDAPGLAGQPREPARPYVVPAAATVTPAALPAARFTRYVFAHSRYSSVLGQSNVLSGLLAAPEESPVRAAEGAGAVINDAALRHADAQDAPPSGQ